MSFQPILPIGGNAGWTFLRTTQDAQQEAFNNSSVIARDTDYFREKIGEIQTAEELVADRRLLSVALGAFGLDDDINNKFYIKTVLEEGVIDPESFANRLSDKRYFAFAEAFGFELSPPKSVLSDFSDKIIAQYKDRQFEVAVGNQDGDLRLALSIEREVASIAEQGLSEDVAWFTIMGNAPLRRVFELALGLPSEIATTDIDRQLEVFVNKAERTFGVSHPADFQDPGLQEKLIRNFLFRSELAASAASTTRGSVALSLLQSQAPLF